MSGQLLSQKDALKRFPVLSEACLNEARRLGQIEWIKGKYSAPYYTETAIEAYISQHRTQRCGKVEDATPKKRTGKIVPMPQDLRDKAAKRIAERI